MRKQTIKTIAIVFIGLLIWIAFVYLTIAFVKVELNPFVWSQAVRGLMVGCIFIYISGIPLFLHELKD
jgi:uncharacterized membrane-anchored protein